VRARRRSTRGGAETDARAQRARVEPERREDLEEEPVLFEAVAAATAAHELVEDGFGREVDAAPEQHVEVLEGDGVDVRRSERVQRLERRSPRPPVADALEVGLEVDGHPRK
jgi:hypothetical protein